MKYKIGDRVKVISVVDENTYIVNKIGTIVYVDDKFMVHPCTVRPYTIEFDEKIKYGHNGNRITVKFKEGCCWNVNEKHIKLFKKIIKRYPITKFWRDYGI